MSSGPSNGVPEKDPFQVLGVSFEASDAEINKAYRKLALKLHPDKQQNVSEHQKAKMAQEFHDIQQAKEFLSEPEFESARTQYKAKLASQRLRRAADEARNKTMSTNRKRMREELQRQEAQATKSMANQRPVSSKPDVMSGLRKEAGTMREDFANKMAAKLEKEAAALKAGKEMRQVRLKWSRKKVGANLSDDSITKLMSRFGAVEGVEMLGSKGNAALVTFVDAVSVAPCVDFYRESDEMRASNMGKLAERQEDMNAGANNYGTNKSTTSTRDGESVADWKLRREMEKEKLLRQMEGEIEMPPANHQHLPKSNFPLPFPSTGEYEGLEPLEKLQKAEEIILSDLVSKDILEQLKVVH